MPKFLVCFRVEQTLSGSIEVEAESAEEARKKFENCDPGDDVDDARLEAKLEIEDSEDSVTEIQTRDGKTVWTEPGAITQLSTSL